MRETAQQFGWKLNFGGIALMWRGGCIIRRSVDLIFVIAQHRHHIVTDSDSYYRLTCSPVHCFEVFLYTVAEFDYASIASVRVSLLLVFVRYFSY